MRSLAPQYSRHVAQLRALEAEAARAGRRLGAPRRAMAIAGTAPLGRIGAGAREPTAMAFGSTRRVAGAAHRQFRSRRWVVVAVWGACFVACLAFWAAVGLAVWSMVG